MDVTRKPLCKFILMEFVLIFVVSVLWNYARKNGESVIDAFGIAALTAVFTYAFARER